MNNVVIFESGDQPVQVWLEGETVWLTQAQMAELFDTSTDNISLHLKNVYTDNELDELATTEDFSVVRQEGTRQVKRQIKHYNLDAIISVGYRVSSTRATQFRIWATRTLRQHLVDGYTLNQQQCRRSLRLQGYDYAQAGAYFVTICTQERACLFGEIVDGQMRLSPAGEMVHRVWTQIPAHIPNVDIDTFVVMRNHIHGILVLAGNRVGAGLVPARDGAPTRGAPTTGWDV